LERRSGSKLRRRNGLGIGNGDALKGFVRNSRITKERFRFMRFIAAEVILQIKIVAGSRPFDKFVDRLIEDLKLRAEKDRVLLIISVKGRDDLDVFLVEH